MGKEIFIDPKVNPLKGHKSAIVIIVTLIAVIAVMSFSPFVIIVAGERGVLLTLGAPEEKPLGEGLHIVIPYYQKVIKYDVKIQKSTITTEAASKDIQEVKTTVALNYHVVPEKVSKVHQQLGFEYRTTIIEPAMNEVIKAVTAIFTAEELITKRPRVSTQMKEGLKERLVVHNIAVDEFSITNFFFSEKFTDAVEEKQTAEQKFLKAKKDLERIEVEAEQRLASAKAEAQSLALQKESISPELVQLRQIEATIKAIEKWNGVLPNVTGGAMPFIDVKAIGRQ
ncbi:MAG: prohibitin family protein [Candidatus Magnetoovum sp. WYHC-5]|nr:prohibitin family protein [Candidatus Magnetoovum sp. WYHC-5]